MRNRYPMRRTFTAVLAVALAASVLTAPGAAAAPAGEPAVAPSRITLVTGDQVLVSGTDVRVLPARRDRPVPFQEYTRRRRQIRRARRRGRLVRAGRLDRELFNVTGLVRQGYDDAHTPHGAAAGHAERAAPGAAPAGARSAAALSGLGMAALDQQKAGTTAFWTADRRASTAGPACAKVWLNAKVRASLDQSVPQIGAPAAWQAG